MDYPPKIFIALLARHSRLPFAPSLSLLALPPPSPPLSRCSLSSTVVVAMQDLIDAAFLNKKRKRRSDNTVVLNLRQDAVWEHTAIAEVNEVSRDGRRIMRARTHVPAPPPVLKSIHDPYAHYTEKDLPWNPDLCDDDLLDTSPNVVEPPLEASMLLRTAKTFATMVRFPVLSSNLRLLFDRRTTRCSSIGGSSGISS